MSLHHSHDDDSNATSISISTNEGADNLSEWESVLSINYYKWSTNHCVKSVHIRSFFGPYFPAFRLNTERFGEFFRIQSECGKIRTWKTPNTDTFPTVNDYKIQKVPVETDIEDAENTLKKKKDTCGKNTNPKFRKSIMRSTIKCKAIWKRLTFGARRICWNLS